jgi:hypothetical protein
VPDIKHTATSFAHDDKSFSRSDGRKRFLGQILYHLKLGQKLPFGVEEFAGRGTKLPFSRKLAKFESI